MSRSRRNDKVDNTDLFYETEILKVKLEQLEKRFELLEKAMSFADKTHSIEVEGLYKEIENMMLVHRELAKDKRGDQHDQKAEQGEEADAPALSQKLPEADVVEDKKDTRPKLLRRIG